MVDPIKLNVKSLEKAVTSLETAILATQKAPSDLFIRDASIHRFKYTYELCHKMLKRYLEMTEPNSEEIDQMQFAQLIRTGSEKGLLLHGWDIWATYRYARNLTSHTYNEEKAIEVCQIIPDFLKDAQFLDESFRALITSDCRQIL